MFFLTLLLCIFSCKNEEPSFLPRGRQIQLPDDTYMISTQDWTGIDDTEIIQKAIDSNSSSLFIPATPGPWVVEPLFIKTDNLTVYFESNTQIIAKKGSFSGRGDCLITIENQRNINLIALGENVRLTMNREDYDRSPYSKAEWRHCISLLSVENININGLIIEKSGGDGIYIGMSKEEEALRYCKNIRIEQCLIDQNYRQGISVISAEDLLISQCSILNTKGTAPQAGIDFEPNRNFQVFNNCVIQDTIIMGNRGSGLLVWLQRLDMESSNVEIIVRNCTITNNRLFGIQIGGLWNNPWGTIELYDVKRGFFNVLRGNSHFKIIKD